jgi:tetratricopeptide (TPR) repeat protein
MGFTARKSFKVMPGVPMTVSKGGISTSAGVRGARVTQTASGKVTRTVGLPGTGLSHTKTISGSQSARSAPATPAKPGVTTPKSEKELYKAITAGRPEELPRIAQAYPEVGPLAAALDGFLAFANGDHDRALDVLGWAWSSGQSIEDQAFTRKYLTTSTVTLEIADGVSAVLPLSRDAIGLALAELHQEAGSVDRAIAVVEALDPSVIAAVSLAELYTLTGRYADVVDLTNGMSNDDDQTALLVTFRGIALREQGHPTAAREAFRDALRSKSRDAAIRHRALVERAETYRSEGKAAMARKDLERVLAEDGEYPGLRERLSALDTPVDRR